MRFFEFLAGLFTRRKRSPGWNWALGENYEPVSAEVVQSVVVQSVVVHSVGQSHLSQDDPGANEPVPALEGKVVLVFSDASKHVFMESDPLVAEFVHVADRMLQPIGSEGRYGSNVGR